VVTEGLSLIADALKMLRVDEMELLPRLLPPEGKASRPRRLRPGVPWGVPRRLAEPPNDEEADSGRLANGRGGRDLGVPMLPPAATLSSPGMEKVTISK
jgi:hypothetical protein